MDDKIISDVEKPDSCEYVSYVPEVNNPIIKEEPDHTTSDTTNEITAQREAYNLSYKEH